MKKQLEAAKQAMVKWLLEEETFGKAPFKIECVNEFDLHDLHYYIFRFKKSFLSDWLVGVVGGYEQDSLEHCGHVFSEFQKYQGDTAVEDCIQMVEQIRAYWIRQAKQIQIQQCFEKNLKFISQCEISVDTIEKQFIKDANHFYLTIGTSHFPSGKIVIADPLAYLPSVHYSPQLEIIIPKGDYPIEVAIYRNEDIGIRMCTTRLKVLNTKAVEYVCAMPTKESAVAVNDQGVLSGFPVDAGMMCICDAVVAEEYRQFLNQWYEENPDKNHYDDYFADYFAQSYEKYPAYQRAGGDFICWENPLFHHTMVMVASGFGDGFYQSYIGYDEQHDVCEIIVPMINPELFENE